MKSNDAIDYTNHIYDSTTDGYIQLIKLADKNIKIYNTDFEGVREVVEAFKNDLDIYITPNTMYRKQRRVQNIRQFRCLYQDIDCKNIGLHKSEVVYIIFTMAYEGEIPMPTIVIDSGNGIHPYWRIKNAPYGAFNTWQELQDFLYYKLKHLGADRQAIDGARVLRLPGTINSKNGETCEIVHIDNDLEYSMYDLREQYLGYKPKQIEFQETKVINKNNSKTVYNKFFNSYSLHMTRVEDLNILCKLRGYDLRGYRNQIVHCYAYWQGIYTRDLNDLEQDVMEFNNSLIEPLKETEVKAILRSVPRAIEKFINYEQGLRAGEIRRVSKGMRDKEGYWYRNETLIERLGITELEERSLKTIIGTEEKYRRNNERRTPRNENGLTKKQQEMQDLKIKVLELREKGLSIKEISKIVGKSESTIKRIK